MALREWVREDVGLLDDEQYVSMPDHLIAAWELLMKITARLPGERFKDTAQMIFQLKRYGRPRAAAVVKELEDREWFVPGPDGEGLRIKGWDKYQLVYRGPSDDPSAKAARNAKRPTTDSARRIAAEEAAQRRKEEDERMKAAATDKPFAEAMAAAGYKPPAISKKPRRRGLDAAAPVGVDSMAARGG